MLIPILTTLIRFFNTQLIKKYCNQMSVHEYNRVCHYQILTFQFFLSNIRSINANSYHMFCLFTDQYSYPEVFVLTETQFNDCNVQDIPLYYAYHTLRNPGRSGSVSIFSKISYKLKRIPELCVSNQII